MDIVAQAFVAKRDRLRHCVTGINTHSRDSRDNL
jgi:hypothetical protein